MFISGGFIVEPIAVFLAGYLLRDMGNLSLIMLSTSSALFLIYVLGDWAASVRNKKPYGDVGALWAIQPLVTVLFLLALTALRAAAITALAVGWAARPCDFTDAGWQSCLSRWW